MGPRETPPELPGLQALGLYDEERSIWCMQRQCNYLQALEGEIDTSHLGFLHGGMAQSEDPTLANRAPKYKVVDTEVGVLYGAFRELDEQHLNWRFASFSLPFWTQPPPTPLGRDRMARAFVPMDERDATLRKRQNSDYQEIFIEKAERGRYLRSAM